MKENNKSNNKKTTRVSRKRKIKKIAIASSIFCLISLISLGIFIYNATTLNVIPTKYLGIMYAVIGIFYLILFIIFFKKKCPIFLRIIAYIISLLFSVIFIVGSSYLDATTDFIKDTEIGDYDIITYSVISLKDNNYNLKDLNNKVIGYLDDENKNDIASKLKNKITYDKVLEKDASTLASNLKLKS